MEKLTVKVAAAELVRLRRQAAAGGLSLSEHVRQHLAVERPLDLRRFDALVAVARERSRGGRLSDAERVRLRALGAAIGAAVQQRDREVVEQLVAPAPSSARRAS